jgi:hypothetical protein
MTLLFISKGCGACSRVQKKIIEEGTKGIHVLEIRYSKEKNKYIVLDSNGEDIGQESPVITVPTLFFLEENKVYTGEEEILRRLNNE